MRDAVQPREAVEEQRRAERPGKEALQRGLVGEAVGPLDPREHVDRDGHRLEAVEERDEIRGQRDRHRADSREADDRVVLAGRDRPSREGCGSTPRRTVSSTSGRAQATARGVMSGSARYASRTGPYITRWNMQSR